MGRRSAEIIPLKAPTNGGCVRITKVYARGKVKENGDCHWAFNMEIGGNSKGFAFGNRPDAVKARVIMRKKLKEDGLKLLS